MSTDAEKLAKVAALCDDHDRRWAGRVGRDAAAFTVADLRKILAEPSPVDANVTVTGFNVIGLPLATVHGPIEGVTLTREEARLAGRALREYGAEPSGLDYTDMDAMDALAARLEGSS